MTQKAFGQDIRRVGRRGWAAGAVVLISAIALIGLVRPAIISAQRPVAQTKLRQSLVDFLRRQYAIVDTVQVTAGPLQPSADPSFYQTLITVQNGTKSSSQLVSISKNGRYVAMTALVPLGPDTRTAITDAMRNDLKLGSEWSLNVGSFHESVAPGFYQTTVTAEAHGQKRAGAFFVTSDKRFLVLGEVYLLRTRSENERLITTRNQPCSGPADAPVTIVEYADLECPMCARMQPFLENDVIPRYGNKVRVVYKDFPLPEHPWSRQAAVANECAYQIDPSAFVRYRTSIFAHQNDINVANVRQMLLDLGEQAGVNRLRLAACIDSQASLPRIEADVREANTLQVISTPTCFINGERVVGLASPSDFFKVIDKALARDRK